MLSEWETFPTCPACGCVDQDWWDGLSTNELARDGDSTEWACPQCERQMTVTICMDYTFQVEVTDE